MGLIYKKIVLRLIQVGLKPPYLQIIRCSYSLSLITLKTVRHRFCLGFCLSISRETSGSRPRDCLFPPPDVGLEPTATSLKGWRSTD